MWYRLSMKLLGERVADSDKEKLFVKLVIPFSALALACGTLMIKHESTYAAQPTFTSKYTEPGECLADTPYDPTNGASMHIDQVNGSWVLSVTPRDANAHNPAVLFFSAREHLFSDADLAPADYATGKLLFDQHCPDQPAGY